MDDALRTQQTAADRVRAVGVDGVPDDGVAEAVEQPSARRGPRLHFVATMGTSLAVSGDIAAWRLLEGETH
jgi:hypothetical protein